ncbi:ribonuclease J [Candidatus Magnetominusculus xianensis]|uniref:Ribonuclease J n=2 Tax=Candidatus Magnetominusculus xianensis TaxID=1748249 RepID=A0ABR5SIW0_9BACT|nr:ribonuclease J [Candidatus Magnetominusculus xianensis]MBF0404166.1 ribonuclease J [Nitrospirota bacterium]
MSQGNKLSDKVMIIPLGGVEEIGANMTLFETHNDMIIVDTGLMFPDDDLLGVDFVIPDYGYVIERKNKLRGIIITHGHEDHTGALPFLLRDLGTAVPVYGTSLTLGLIKDKIKEHNVKNINFVKIKPKDKAELGDFVVEFIRVTHSIADGVGLAITTPAGVIIHTGDFKFDSSPVDNELLDFGSFSEYGERGVLAMLSDSTNAEKPGFTPSEKIVKRAFHDIFSKAGGRIIIATFASNIHRIQQAIDVAAEFGKKIILCGRSIISNAKIAIDLGYLTMNGNSWLKVEQINSLAPNETVIITTGSQGEPMSVLTRIAMNEHKHIKVAPADTVIISARAIPGNERAVGRIINHLFRRGANVIYDKISEVHVSGHASQEELKLMINIVKPRYFIPIHGEYRHLVYHSKLAEGLGIPRQNIYILEDGCVLELSQTGASRINSVPAGRVSIEGKGFGDIGDMILKDRRRLAQDGFVIVVLTVNKETGRVEEGPEFITKGFIFEHNTGDMAKEAANIIYSIAANPDEGTHGDMNVLHAKILSALKKYIRNKTDKRPMIMPVIVPV